jgi:hypothetical protein
MADSDTLPIRLSPIWADDLRRPKGPRTHALLPPLQDCRALNETLWLLGEV